MHSCYQTKGAFKHVEVDCDCETFIATGVTRRTFLEILLLYFLIPYTFIRRRIKKPPKDGYVSYFCSVTSYLAINSILVGIGISRVVLFRWNFRQTRFAKKNTRSDLFCATSKNVDEQPILFDTDGITFLVDNCANTHVCNDKKLFCNLSSTATASLNTTNGSSEANLQSGRIKISWADDDNIEHEYNLDDVIYKPDSPFNILSVARLGGHFGRNDSPPTGDDEGTWVRSSASFTTFSWDHKRHTRTIYHSVDGLPELPVNVGTSVFDSFCSGLKRFYCDKINLSFATVIDYEDDELETDSSKPDEEISLTYQPGSDVYYKSGDGENKVAKYLATRENEGAETHLIRFEDGRETTTTSSHIQFLEQPDLTNIPVDPESYTDEVQEGLTSEQIQEIARPTTLSPLQQELLFWHNRLGHLPFHRLIKLAQQGIIPRRLAALKDKPPVCVSCLFGKAHKRPWRNKSKQSNPIRSKDQTKPGDCVSTDQIVSAQPGLVPQMSGFLTSDRIWGVTVFVDHATDWTYGHLMRNLSLDETLLAKRAFEKLLARGNHTVKRYHADNGRYADKGFLDSVNECNQVITFCGVGAHHQNGVVERRIRVITETSRTLLLHAQRHWPEYVDTMLWPFAVKVAIERLNCLQMDLDGITPNAKMFNTQQMRMNVGDYHVFGCPVFVLDSKLQSQSIGLPKWEPRSRVGVYLGHSPMHAGSVALVMNPKTGHVSPQYHVVFDDTFSTVSHMREGTIPSNWNEMCKNATECATDEEFDLAHTWFRDNNKQPMGAKLTDPFVVVSDQSGDKKTSASEGEANTPNLGKDGEGANVVAADSNIESTARPKTVSFADEQKTDAVTTSTASAALPKERATEMMPKMINLSESGLRRSERLRALREKKKQEAEHPPKNKSAFATQKVLGLFSVLSTVCLTMTSPTIRLHEDATTYDKLVNRFHEANELFDGSMNVLNCTVLATESNENYTYSQMIQQDDKGDFITAMGTEVTAHEDRNHWTMVQRSTMPVGTKTIRAIWSFKRKRFPDGRLNKHKARLCAHGGMQKWGENYWETYSPVVNMLSVRLLLAIAHIHGLDSKAIDFVLAFPQADLDIDVWMELPEGMVPLGDEASSKRYVLKLNKSLYGLKQASHNWYEKLKKALIDRGFRPSQIDPCIFMKDGMIMLVYVDDCIIISDSIARIDVLIHSLMNGPEKFVLTDEGTLDKFLGINISKLDDGRYEFTQPFLIDRIIKFINTEYPTELTGRESLTPVGKPLLHKDLEGKPRKYKWNFRTAVGMIGYLQQSTRPEISMASHQCARFVNQPMRSHERAIIRIVRYLNNTKDKGIIFEPDPELGLECFVDADFAGGWCQADADNPENVMSRTGFVIRYAGCPIGWCSKLQTEIALSTAEAEYIALSQALREVIPLMTLLQELNEIFPLYISKPDFFCKVFEDNQSCIAMTESTKFTPRTKHIALKYHHFKSYVDSKRIRIEYIRSEDQLADIFTKPIMDGQFFVLRYKLCGW